MKHVETIFISGSVGTVWKATNAGCNSTINSRTSYFGFSADLFTMLFKPVFWQNAYIEAKWGRCYFTVGSQWRGVRQSAGCCSCPLKFVPHSFHSSLMLIVHLWTSQTHLKALFTVTVQPSHKNKKSWSLTNVKLKFIRPYNFNWTYTLNCIIPALISNCFKNRSIDWFYSWINRTLNPGDKVRLTTGPKLFHCPGSVYDLLPWGRCCRVPVKYRKRHLNRYKNTFISLSLILPNAGWYEMRSCVPCVHVFSVVVHYRVCMYVVWLCTCLCYAVISCFIACMYICGSLHVDDKFPWWYLGWDMVMFNICHLTNQNMKHCTTFCTVSLQKNSALHLHLLNTTSCIHTPGQSHRCPCELANTRLMSERCSDVLLTLMKHTATFNPPLVALAELFLG